MNRKDQKSEFINERQVCNVVHAAEFAQHTKHDLNCFLTLHLERGGIEHQDQSRFIKRFDKLVEDFLSRHGVPWAAISVLENPPSKGRNWHLAFHLPDHLRDRFRRRYRRWLKKTGLVIKKDVVMLQRIQPTPEDVRSVIGYMLKGAHPTMCEMLGIQHGYQGMIVGKRVRISEAINRKARSRDGQFSDRHPRQYFVDPVTYRTL